MCAANHKLTLIRYINCCVLVTTRSGVIPYYVTNLFWLLCLGWWSAEQLYWLPIGYFWHVNVFISTFKHSHLHSLLLTTVVYCSAAIIQVLVNQARAHLSSRWSEYRSMCVCTFTITLGVMLVCNLINCVIRWKIITGHALLFGYYNNTHPITAHMFVNLHTGSSTRMDLHVMNVSNFDRLSTATPSNRWQRLLKEWKF